MSNFRSSVGDVMNTTISWETALKLKQWKRKEKKVDKNQEEDEPDSNPKAQERKEETRPKEKTEAIRMTK